MSSHKQFPRTSIVCLQGSSLFSLLFATWVIRGLVCLVASQSNRTFFFLLFSLWRSSFQAVFQSFAGLSPALQLNCRSLDSEFDLIWFFKRRLREIIVEAVEICLAQPSGFYVSVPFISFLITSNYPVSSFWVSPGLSRKYPFIMIKVFKEHKNVKSCSTLKSNRGAGKIAIKGRPECLQQVGNSQWVCQAQIGAR